MKEWREHQTVYKDFQTAEAAYLTHVEESARLHSASEAARLAYEASDTAKLYEEGVRQCAKSKSAFTLPAAPAETETRIAAEKKTQTLLDQETKAKQTVEKKLAEQADSMAKYATVSS